MLSRRTFLGTAAACAVAAKAARPEDRLELREFSYPQVTLTHGPIADMYHRTRAHFLKLDEELPFTARTLAIEERAPDVVAAMRGPVMLAAVNPPDEPAAPARAPAEMEAVPGGPLEFDCNTAAGKVRMRPWYRLQRETYSTYSGGPVNNRDPAIAAASPRRTGKRL